MDWNGQYILDPAGNAVPEPDLMKWAGWFQTADRIVQKDDIDGLHLSTVFLGLDHNFGYGKPLIFESMIFDRSSKRPWADLYCERYSTMAEAKLGHQALLKRIKDGEFDKEPDADL